jgi:tetratricopeptide (TPR) repeat protein
MKAKKTFDTKFCLIILKGFIFSLVTANAQNLCDSLQNALSGNKINDEKIYEIKLSLSENCFNNNINKQISFLTEAVEIGQKLKKSSLEGKALYKLADCYLRNGSIASAYSLAEKALEVSRRDKINFELQVLTTKLLSSIVYEQGDVSRAFQLLNEAIKITDEKKLSELSSECRLLYGNIYTGIGKFNEAELKYKEALNFLSPREEKISSILYSNLGTLYINMRNFNSANICFEKALELKRKNKDLKGEFLVMYQMAMLASANNNSEKSIKLLNQCLILSKELNDKILIGSTHKGLSAVYNKNGNYEESSIQIEKAILNFRISGERNELLETYNAASDIYQKLGKKETAEIYKNEFNALNDSIKKHLNSNIKTTLQENNTQSKTEQKDSENKPYYYLIIPIIAGLLILIFIWLKKGKK